ncbi:hypothetical protein KR100_04280 [Synechococcus sp. KORDI-100]|uniref:hypothetical protein n=1 Tax=Synechococcus sp. KORDI-100 TaxID=1280380 RepID=UPI0004E0A95B|nr:hypothetical protein [Synechococcus sp. KORDI-100]AII42583.1 hypothetical protein KR100_04280 [Synechococcus sp. KORDI-100]
MNKGVEFSQLKAVHRDRLAHPHHFRGKTGLGADIWIIAADFLNPLLQTLSKDRRHRQEQNTCDHKELHDLVQRCLEHNLYFKATQASGVKEKDLKINVELLKPENHTIRANNNQKNNCNLPTNAGGKHHRCHDLLKHKRGTDNDKDTSQGLDLDGETDVVWCGDNAELAAPSDHLFIES